MQRRKQCFELRSRSFFDVGVIMFQPTWPPPYLSLSNIIKPPPSRILAIFGGEGRGVRITFEAMEIRFLNLT